MKKLIIASLISILLPFVAFAAWYDFLIPNWFGSAPAETTFGAPVSNIFRNILPSKDITYDLGTTTQRWLHIFTQNASTTNISVDGLVSCDTIDTDAEGRFVCGTDEGAGEANTASSLGTGINLFDSKLGVDLRFNTISAGSNITLSTTTQANTIVISSTGGGGAFAWTLDDDGVSTTTQLSFLGGASTTRFSVFNNAYFGATATSTFDSAGVLTLSTPLADASVADTLTIGAGSTVDKGALANVGTLGFTWSDAEVSDTLTASNLVSGLSVVSDAEVDDNITLTNITQITNRAITDTTGTLPETRGGTNQTTYTTGDILYANASNSLAKLTVGASSTLLTTNGTTPFWMATSSLGFLSHNDISGDITIAQNGVATISANAVALGTDTTGNYIATIADAGNSTITVVGSGAESAAVTLDAVGLNCTNCLNATQIDETFNWTGTIDGNNFAGGAIGAGDLLYGASAGSITELPIGASSTLLISNGTSPFWMATSSLGFLSHNDISGDATVSQAGVLTISANAVALGTDTTGFYAAGDAEAGNALSGDSATGFFSSGVLEVGIGGTGATTLTDGGVLLGSGAGAITAMPVLANGSIIIGDGTTDPTTISAFTSSVGTLKHEVGGLEFNASAVTTGDIIYGSGVGSMGLLTVGASSTILTAVGTTLGYTANPAFETLRITEDGLAVSAGGIDITGGGLNIGTTTPTSGFVASSTFAVSGEVKINSAASMTIDWSRGNQQLLILENDSASITMTGAYGGQTLRLVVCQDSVGGKTINSYGENVLWPAGATTTLTTTAGRCDVLSFLATAATSTYGGGFRYFAVGLTDFSE